MKQLSHATFVFVLIASALWPPIATGAVPGAGENAQARTGTAQPFGKVLGPRFTPALDARDLRRDRPDRAHDAAEHLLRWNAIAVDASGLDHTPVATGETRTFGHQLGPGRASRAMAIVHIAMFDVVNAVVPRYRPYTRLKPPPFLTSMSAAIVQAAHDTLVAVFPSHAPAFDDLLAEDLSAIPDGRAKANPTSAVSMVETSAIKDLGLRVGTTFVVGGDLEAFRQAQAEAIQ